jgi:chromosomal replication initiator protein
LVSVEFKLKNEIQEVGEFDGLETMNDWARLNPEQSFEHFIEGPENRLALAAAKAVSLEPGREYNPLLICASAGSGKTHLLHAIGRNFKEHRPDKTCICCSCDELANQVVNALEQSVLPILQEGLQGADLLLVDDIDRISGRLRTQEVLFQVLESRLAADQQVILSSCCLPPEISGLSPRLSSRLGSGLTVRMDSPCLETLAGITRVKAKLHGFELSAEAAHAIAEYAEGDPRRLNEALRRVEVVCGMEGHEVSAEAVRRALDLFPLEEIYVPRIVDLMERRFRLNPGELSKKDRSKRINGLRQVAMYLARQLTSLSLGDIGAHFGGRNHSTVLHAVRAVSRRMGMDDRLRRQVTELMNDVKRQGTSSLS